ncbi:type VI secretion lipoprotein, VC_A0113 family [Salmonella enterica subsp. enterica]|nr:type VI secretion lipoprotein, VC_A0113 family [Salmonella enterica subsp. enterica]
MTGRGFLAWAMVALFTLALCGCETVKKSAR